VREDIDEDEDRPVRRRPEFPLLVRIAGIIWIVFGCVILLNAAVSLLVSLGQAAPRGGAEAAGRATGSMCGVAVILLFGGAFILVGVQSIRGTAKDTLGNGIGSIVFGFLNLGCGLMLMLGGAMAGGGAGVVILIGSAISLLAGVGLLAAGVLALIGRDAYKTWRRAQKARTTRRRTRTEDSFDA
jgi:hypothetical protein